MGSRFFKKAALCMTMTAVLSMTAFPAAASPVYIDTGESSAAASSDGSFVYGLDLEARIIQTAEQDQRSPFAKKGIAITDDYLKIRVSPEKDADYVGKLYKGAGCDVESVEGGWAKIKSGECEGYVKAKYLLTGAEAEAYAKKNNLSELFAKADKEEDLNLYKEPSADSEVINTVAWDQDLKVVGATPDNLWMKVEIDKEKGYLPTDSLLLDVQYEEAITIEAERAAEEAKRAEEERKRAEEEARKAAEEAERKAAEEEARKAEEEARAAAEAAEQAEEPETEAEQTASVNIEEANETVWATLSVSIRSSYSADSEKLAVLYGGESLTRTGICDNGWSRVDYNGETAYIKSEYLTTEEPALPEENTEEPETQQEETTRETVYATTGVNIREKASADSDIVGALIAGYSVTRTGTEGDWSKVEFEGGTGYIKSEYLTTEKPAEVAPETQQEEEAQQQTEQQEEQPQQEEQKPAEASVSEVDETVYATAGVNIRAKASSDSEKVGSLATNSSIHRTGKTDNGWSRVEFGGKTGYIKSDYLTTEKPKVETTSETEASNESSSSNSGSSSSSSLGQQIADFACQYVGYPYVYGGNSLTNGVDCSGFTQQVYLHFGYSIPRRASIQATVGTSVSISNLQPGDLVFYGDSTGVGHVTIYIGNGQVVHASTPTKGIIISDMNYRAPMCAKRII